jgi:hypothetical protein
MEADAPNTTRAKPEGVEGLERTARREAARSAPSRTIVRRCACANEAARPNCALKVELLFDNANFFANIFPKYLCVDFVSFY